MARRWAAATVLALALASAGALAYVRSVTDHYTPVQWSSSCAWIAADSAGSPDLPLSVVESTLQKSLLNWQSATLTKGCTYLQLMMDPPAPGEALLDRKNVLKFRTDKWCRPAEPSKGQNEMCYPHQAAAITTVFYSNDPGKSDDGNIIDADIQMNDLDFTFVVEPTTAQPRKGTTISDLENTLTHELGHFQGLDHTCWDQAAPYQNMPPKDNAGASVPDCTKLDQIPIAKKLQIVTATMYNYASPGEIVKRTPKADDIAAICGIYPAGGAVPACLRASQQVKGGCSLAGASTPSPWSGAALLLLAALGLGRRRWRRG
jgi:MYXO-CTERM domain-containing protein